MPAQRESLPSVTAAGVVAIIFGVFAAFGCLMVALVLLLMPQLQSAPGVAPMPPEVRAFSAVSLFFFLALAIFGIFVGAGVLRRRNWARITMLIWGGLMTLFGLMIVGFSLVVFNSAAGFNLPNANGVQAAQAMAFVKIFMVIFYGIPAAIGIWWLVLFTRPRVADAFTHPLLSPSPVLDASGFPQPALTTSPVQNKPTCPLPIAVIATLMALGSVFMLIFALMPLYSKVPLFFFGHAFNGSSAKLILLVWGLVSLLASIGVFLLKPWALHTQIGIQLFGLLNSAVAILSPNYPATMRETMQKIYANNSALAANSAFMTDSYFRSLMIMTTLMLAVILVILVWQRPRFLEQAALAAKP